jgi:hypothetical protein
MRKFKRLTLLIFWFIVVPLTASAGDFDGSKPLLRAIIEVVECTEGGECERRTVQDIDIPRFFRIDFKGKTITGKRLNGDLRTTKIEKMQNTDGKLILQGVQNDKAWSVVITKGTGNMTLTVSDDQTGFIIFGACTDI